MFSDRTSWPLLPNRLHRLARQRRAQGDFCDLTISNPTICGFHYPANLLAALAAPAALRYEPQPFGLATARAAVVDYYRERGLELRERRVALTASTSEAYCHLFRLLCNPGDAVLAPAPSYPLLDLLAGLENVTVRAVPMLYDHGWQLDVDTLAAAETGVRALFLVHPNNPAGNYIKPPEWLKLQELAAARGWAIVVDEVFFDYPMDSAVALQFDHCPALTFLLNGCSKISALPQMKLGWIAGFGPETLAAPAWERLEMVLDLFLSVSAPAQQAAPALLGARHALQPQIRERLRTNLTALDAALAGHPAVERLRMEGGWTALLRLPRILSDEAWAERLVESSGVLTHPGHFYGLPQEACLALSLLPPAANFDRGLARLARGIAAEME
ncbi:MAG: pyridoxal phosphate-dependent aminotransferase [Terriglobales bacterium]